MHPYPPYSALLIVAQNCPECLSTLLGLYERRQTLNSNMITFDCELTDGVHQVGWIDFIQSLNELEMWDLIAYEFTAKDKLEVTLPEPQINASGKAIF